MSTCMYACSVCADTRDMIFHWPRTCWFSQVGWPAMCLSGHCFYVDDRGPNSGLYACVASTLLSKLASQTDHKLLILLPALPKGKDCTLALSSLCGNETKPRESCILDKHSTNPVTFSDQILLMLGKFLFIAVCFLRAWWMAWLLLRVYTALAEGWNSLCFLVPISKTHDCLVFQLGTRYPWPPWAPVLIGTYPIEKKVH